MNIDENEFAIAGKKILSDAIPYQDIFIYQPPFPFYFYASGLELFGSSTLFGPHLFLMLWVFLTAVILGQIAKRLYPFANIEWWTAASFIVFSTTFLPQDMLGVNGEILMALPASLAILLILEARKRSSFFFYFLSGLSIGWAILAKYFAGLLWLTILLLLLLDVVRKRRSLRESVFASMVVTLATFLPSLLVIGWLSWRGALDDAINCFLYILKYAQGPSQNDPLYLFLKFTSYTTLIAWCGLFLWIGAFARTIDDLRHRESNGELLIVIWFLSSFVAIIAGGRMYYHYYVVAYPPLVLLGTAWLCERSEAWWRKWKSFFVIMTSVSVLVFFFYAWSHSHLRGNEKDNWIAPKEFLRLHAKKGDTLFVWGYCPQLYFLSGMDTATPFTTADYLTGRSPKSAGLEYDPQMPNPPSGWKKFLNDFRDPQGVVEYDTSDNIFPPAWDILREHFEKKLPNYIVDTAPSNYRRYGRYPMSRYPYLQNIVQTHYVLFAQLRGFDIYLLRDDHETN